MSVRWGGTRNVMWGPWSVLQRLSQLWDFVLRRKGVTLRSGSLWGRRRFLRTPGVPVPSTTPIPTLTFNLGVPPPFRFLCFRHRRRRGDSERHSSLLGTNGPYFVHKGPWMMYAQTTLYVPTPCRGLLRGRRGRRGVDMCRYEGRGRRDHPLLTTESKVNRKRTNERFKT